MKHKVWTNQDTRKARAHFEKLVTRKSPVRKQVEAEDQPVDEQELVKHLVYFANCYSQGCLTTENFLRIVKDLAGGIS